MLLVGGWAAREVKSGVCAEAAEIPKGKELSQLVASGQGSSRHLNMSWVVSLGSKERLKFAFRSLTVQAAGED